MSECLSSTLSEVVDRFLLRISVDQKKHFARYLILAEECWEDIFQNTLWVIKSVWLPTKAGDPYNYISMPADCQRLLSVGVDDHCGLIQPLYYNSQLNVIVKPTTKKCGCGQDCGCEGLCEAVNSMITTTKLMFSINGINYYQKCWTQYCPNGDILEFCETPAQKFNNLVGDSGDFNSDYNSDYDIGSSPFLDYTIETIKSQKKICKLEIAQCGCPVNTIENEQLFLDCCGYYTNWNCRSRRKHCRQFSDNINSNKLGEIKISECGTKIYYKPSRHWKAVTSKEFPDFLLINYQTTGTSVGSEVLVPKYARNLMYAMMDSSRKEYNSAFSLSEKEAANYKKVDEKNKIMGYLSSVTLEELSNVQDQIIRW